MGQNTLHRWNGKNCELLQPVLLYPHKQPYLVKINFQNISQYLNINNIIVYIYLRSYCDEFCCLQEMARGPR